MIYVFDFQLLISHYSKVIISNRKKLKALHQLDWFILLAVLVGITAYGMWRTRKKTDAQTYLVGEKKLRWWTIALSIMATQASAITFLSTTGQGFDDGMRFAQFYIGMPIAMIILTNFFLPIYYRLNVMTAYQYLEQRFDKPTRTLAACLFLLQRGMAAGLTIYAPSIVLSIILGWDLMLTNVFLGIFVIIYTVFGGGEAVSVTQQQQMIVIFSGLILAFVVMVLKLPDSVAFGDAISAAADLGKMNVFTFDFNLNDRYNIWTGLLGGTFLFLSYFGTDQSQVQRYLSGKSMEESRFGLLFNGFIKFPMQLLVLLVGVMMFIFYQFNPSPIHFNPDNLAKIKSDTLYNAQITALETEQNTVFEAKKTALQNLIAAKHTGDAAAQSVAKEQITTLIKSDKFLRDSTKRIIVKANPKAEKKDTDYVFITFVINHLPIGIVGLLLAVIFSAAMSSTSSEINALATTSVVDIYQSLFNKNVSDDRLMFLSKGLTAFWGILAMSFALFASLLENLIEAVNIVGSLFYGTILGIFVVGFFFKKIGGRAVLFAALITEMVVIFIFSKDMIAYLWLNLIGCVLVVLLSSIFQLFLPKQKSINHK